jgi:hypothetical protein
MHRNPTGQQLAPPTTAEIVGAISNEIAAAGQPSVQGTQAVSKSNDDGLTHLTARGETEAIEALAMQFGKNLDQTTRDVALAWLRSEGFTLSDRGFLNRVWPSARVRVGLLAKAPPGAKKKLKH